MTLYELTEKMRGFEFDVNEDGEITNIEELDTLQMERDEKIENVALYIKNLKAEAEAIGEEAKRLTERKRVAENKAKRLTTYLQDCLHGEKFKTPKVAISYRKSIQTVVTDIEALPRMFVKVKEEPDKTGIKKAINSGIKVEGAHLEETVSMQLK
jgi:hypothetical protein